MIAFYTLRLSFTLFWNWTNPLCSFTQVVPAWSSHEHFVDDDEYRYISQFSLNSQRPKTLPLYLTCARMLQLPGISRFSTFSRSSFSRYLPFNEKTTFPPLSIDHPEDQPECHMSLALSHLSIHHNHCLSWKRKKQSPTLEEMMMMMMMITQLGGDATRRTPTDAPTVQVHLP